MSRKQNTSALQTNVTVQGNSAQQTSVDIHVEALKDRFKARSIPLETDFWDLIDVADCGRKAVGMSPDVTPVTNTGLTLDNDTGQLKVQPEPDKGISVTDNGIGVVVAPDKGIQLDANGIGVNHDDTLRIINGNQLGVADNYVTKSGDSTIKGGSLTIESDNEGISFYDGARIFKQSGVSSLRWYKGTNNALPQICDNNGNNASNIATENYVNNTVNNSVVGWKKIIAELHGCDLFADYYGIRLYAKSGINPCVVYVYCVNNTILVDWYNRETTLNGVAASRKLGKTHYSHDGTTSGTPVIDMFIFPTVANVGSELRDLLCSWDDELGTYYPGNAVFSSI